MAAIENQYVEVILFRRGPTGTEFLLLQRASDEGVYPGMWQTVTGKIRERETALRAARRELFEETGLQPEKFWTVPFVNSFYDSGRDVLQMLPVFAAEIRKDATPTLSHEHQDSRWFEFDGAVKQLPWPGTRRALKVVEEFIVSGARASGLTEIQTEHS